MKYQNIEKDSMLNGDGIRVVLWVSGCEHHCKGCQNPVAWDPNDGVEFDGKAVLEICAELEKDYVSGLTISGGDPLHPANRETVLDICKNVKRLFPDKTIWLYTGYTMLGYALDICQNMSESILKYIDVLVDGRFIEELKDVHYKWAGSTNQIVWKKNGDMWFPTQEYEEKLNGMSEKGCCDT